MLRLAVLKINSIDYARLEQSRLIIEVSQETGRKIKLGGQDQQ